MPSAEADGICWRLHPRRECVVRKTSEHLLRTGGAEGGQARLRRAVSGPKVRLATEGAANEQLLTPTYEVIWSGLG